MAQFFTWRRCLVLAAALTLIGAMVGSSPATAQQQTGNLYGTVMDPDGSPLPGVTVNLTGIGAPQTQVTDAQGSFRFLNLAPGLYQVSASLEGFSAIEYPNVSIRVGRNTTIEATVSPAVEETITVTSESPLLDERKITAGTTVTQIELEKIPSARDPWSILTQTPGVLTDRINVGGNESGQQSVFVGPGSTDDENTFAVDGVIITDMAAIGASPTYYDFDQFQEMQITTGGTDITTVTAGVTMNLVTKRGSNTPRGSARYMLTESDEIFGLFEQARPEIENELCNDSPHCGNGTPQARLAGNTIGEILDYGFEAGGPVVEDRLWLWASYGRNDIKQFAASGTPDNTLLENTSVKLNAQITSPNSIVGSWNRGDKLKDGRGAGPSRPLLSTWDQSGPTEIVKIEDSHVFTSSFFLTGMYSFVDGGFGLLAKGGSGSSAPEVVLGDNFVYQNSFQSGISDRNVDTYQLDGSYFFDTGNLNHELKFGTSYREFEVQSDFSWPGGRDIVNFTGAAYGFDEPFAVFQADRMGAAPITQEYTSFWLQDTLTRGRLTVNAGLRYDLQEATNEATALAGPQVDDIVLDNQGNALPLSSLLPTLSFGGNDAFFDWETILPRVGLTYALGAEQKTLLRASYARFAEQLETGDIIRVNPLGTAYAYFVFDDVNGNNKWDPGTDGTAELFDFAGFNPADPFSLSNPNQNDPNMDPPITDELIVGVEHALLPEFVVGLSGTYRVVSDVLELRTLLDDGSLVTRDMFFPATTTSGLLPGGGTFSETVWGLPADIAARRTGGQLMTNGGREVEALGWSLNATKRLSNRWMARGYVTYGDAEWKIDSGDLRFFDPTNVQEVFPTGGNGTGDQDGELAATQSAGSGNKGDVWIQSTWSVNLNGMYQFWPDRPWGFNLAANLFAREGYPLPYFRIVTTEDGSKRVQLTDEIDSFRADEILTTDLRAEKDIPFGDNLSGTFSIDVFNLFNENYVLQRETQFGSRFDHLDETLSPRIYRLGFRVNWR